MNDKNLLDCTQSVYDFLMDDIIDTNRSFSSFMEIESFKTMNQVLIKNGFCKKNSKTSDMVFFTQFLNRMFEIEEVDEFDYILNNNPKSFFSSEKSKYFYRSIIRELKIKLCFQN